MTLPIYDKLNSRQTPGNQNEKLRKIVELENSAPRNISTTKNENNIGHAYLEMMKIEPTASKHKRNFTTLPTWEPALYPM